MAKVPSSPIIVALMMEALHSSETSVLTRTTWRNITGDGIVLSGLCSSSVIVNYYTLVLDFIVRNFE
jgi:hypothetical protein